MKYRSRKGKAEARAELLAGAKIEAIVEKYGFHKITVRLWAIDLGLAYEKKHYQWNQYRDLLESTLTGTEVAGRIGCSIGSVSIQRMAMRKKQTHRPYQTNYLGWLKRMIAKYGKNIVDVRRGEEIEERLAGLGRNAIVLR